MDKSAISSYLFDWVFGGIIGGFIGGIIGFLTSKFFARQSDKALQKHLQQAAVQLDTRAGELVTETREVRELTTILARYLHSAGLIQARFGKGGKLENITFTANINAQSSPATVQATATFTPPAAPDPPVS
jgi:hypothetical protein